MLLLSKDKRINSRDSDVIDHIVDKIREHHDIIDLHVHPEKQVSNVDSTLSLVDMYGENSKVSTNENVLSIILAKKKTRYDSKCLLAI